MVVKTVNAGVLGREAAPAPAAEVAVTVLTVGVPTEPFTAYMGMVL
jgi:TctA family transporter